MENGSSHVFSGCCSPLGRVGDKLIRVTIPDPLPPLTFEPVAPHDKAKFIGTVQAAHHGPDRVPASLRKRCMARI